MFLIKLYVLSDLFDLNKSEEFFFEDEIMRRRRLLRRQKIFMSMILYIY